MASHSMASSRHGNGADGTSTRDPPKLPEESFRDAMLKVFDSAASDGCVSPRQVARLTEFEWHSKEKHADGDANVDADAGAALLMAAEYGNAFLVREILARNAIANVVKARNRRDETALVVAASRGDTGCVAALLQYGADPLAKTKYGRSALIYAVSLGNEECVRLLLDFGANANEEDQHGVSVLMRAAFSLNEGCVRMLLRAGANANTKATSDGRGALHSLVTRGIPWRGPRSRRPSQQTLIIAELLIRFGAAINDVDSADMSALDYCARDRCTSLSTALFQRLLLKGADMNSTKHSMSGSTALMTLFCRFDSAGGSEYTNFESLLVLNASQMSTEHKARLLRE